MEPKNLSNIYRVESIPQRKIEIANKLLEKGWVLLGVEQNAGLNMDGIPETSVYMLVGATKDVYNKINLNDLSQNSNNPVQF